MKEKFEYKKVSQLFSGILVRTSQLRSFLLSSGDMYNPKSSLGDNVSTNQRIVVTDSNRDFLKISQQKIADGTIFD